MRLAPPAQLAVRARQNPARNELLLRYAAAYSCTLIAILGAQLYIPTVLSLILAAITLIGLPISLYLRWSNLRVFGKQIPRIVINSLMMTITVFSCGYFLMLAQPELFSRSLYHTLLLASGPGDSIAILMTMFLLFAAIRSLAIINDKDAVLSAVPSFSVLLLLIVVHRGPAVVVYFLLWSVVAATLFALDHRQESRQHLSGTIPSLEPGQDIKLSARGLASTMGFSLACAIAISYYVSSRDANDRGIVEAWILGMAGRVTKMALNIPDVSVNSGPERQINFSSGPALPTQAELWKVQAFTYNWELTQSRNWQLQSVQPEYWRMFTLSKYDGASWSQATGAGTTIPFQLLNEKQWPRVPYPSRRLLDLSRRRARAENDSTNRRGRRNRIGPERFVPDRLGPPRPRAGEGSTPSTGNNGLPGAKKPNFNPSPRNAPPVIIRIPRFKRKGFSIATRHPYGKRIVRSFGSDPHTIVQIVQPLAANVGFAPALPAINAVRIQTKNARASVRARQDGAVDIGVIQPGERMLILSAVSPGENYGFGRKLPGVPYEKSLRPTDKRITLSSQERSNNLSLPAALQLPDSRIKLLAKEVLKDSPTNETNYARARRLALMVQNRGVYTLRPPPIPASVDAAEYFLFESRRGYCTYFAGALTVLCRASGIPARVVSGFVNPEWAGQDQPGVLREANAHAWTEVWVDGWGWASLDATPPDNRGENAPNWWQNWQDVFAATFVAAKYWVRNHRFWLLAAVVFLSALLMTFLARRGFADPLRARLHRTTNGRVRLSRDQSRRLIVNAYQRAAKKLTRRFRRRVDWETPREWLENAEAALGLENPHALRELTRLFLQAQYSPRAISEAEGVAAYEALKNVSWKRKN